MELKLYLDPCDYPTFAQSSGDESILSSREKSVITDVEGPVTFKELYKTKISKKRKNLDAVVKFIIKNDIKKIVSIGTGFPIQEYYIAKKTGALVTCYDFDKSLISKTKKIFKEKITISFYDMNTPVSDIINHRDDVDCVIFFQSLYIFSSKQYVAYINELSKLKIKYVIDKASTTSAAEILYNRVSRAIKYFMSTPTGKWHGYSRTLGNLFSIYQQTNYNLIDSHDQFFYLELISNTKNYS